MPVKHEKMRTITDQNLQETRQHGTKDFPLGVYLDDLAEFEQGRIPWHWHEEIQFDLVMEGDVRFQIGSRDILLREGQAIFINTGVLHQIVPAQEAGGRINAYVLRHSLLETDVLSAVYQNCLLPVLKGQADCIVFQEPEGVDRQAVWYLRQIRDSFTEKEEGYQIRVKGLLCCLWSCLLEKDRQDISLIPAKERRDMERVKSAISFMQAHYAEPVSLEKISVHLALSKSELCRCFQRVMRITPYEYLIQYRIREASKRLRHTDAQILDIALQCGFDSIGHMGRYFRRYCGCSPSVFRKQSGRA